MTMDLSRLKRYSLFSRKSKVSRRWFSSPYSVGNGLTGLLDAIPSILAGEDLKFLVRRWLWSKSEGAPVIVGMGAHVIKVGLSPLIIQLMEEGFIDHLAVTGAFLVHDSEMAMAGVTSEDVAEQIKDGSFGMAEETSRFVNGAVEKGVSNGHGIGRSVASALYESDFENKELSILAACERCGVSVSVHVAIGTDITHMHPEADGALIGEGSMRDFRLFVEKVAGLECGLYLNVGSAVILPEVFLKAVSMARNLGHPLKNVVTAALDFQRHYRVMENVVRRPLVEEGKGIYIVGHHELTIPLIAGLLLEGKHAGKK